MSEDRNYLQKRLIELAPGVAVESDVLGIAEKIREYDPNLRLQFLDPAQSDSPTDPPWRIVEMCRDGLPRVVFGVWKLDDLVVERLKLADTQKIDILASIDKQNQQVQRDAQRRYRDMMGETQELVGDIIKSPKSTYTARDPYDGELKKFQ